MMSIKVNILQQHMKFPLDQSSVLSDICLKTLTNDDTYLSSYSIDQQTSTMIRMCRDPSLITPENLLKIHSNYCQPIQDNNFSFHKNRLKLKDIIAYSTHTITLIIILINLCKRVFLYCSMSNLSMATIHTIIRFIASD